MRCISYTTNYTRSLVEDDTEILVEDDGWEEEEVEVEDEDDPISDLDSEHMED